jgi:hypothetical protein
MELITDVRAHSQEQESIMQYLLGQAGPAESSSFEERLITEKGFYDELTIAEDELIDQYLDGDLTGVEREQFESHFLSSPERRQKVRFGNALFQVADRNADADVRVPVHLFQPRAIVPYAVLALLVIVGIGFWAIWKQSNVRVSGKVASITLLPGTTRADQPVNKISNSADVATIQLRLALTNPQESYRVKVVNGDETEVWSGDGRLQTDSNNSFIVADVPAQLLPNGDYQALLSHKLPDGSFEESSSYSFRIIP